jgi:hypothetical protein
MAVASGRRFNPVRDLLSASEDTATDAILH